MLVILSQKVDSESSYTDELFNSYHYPARYKNQLHKGDIFIYYQGNRYDKSQRYYFGVGSVGEIQTTDGENYYAKLLDCQQFERKVPIYLLTVDILNNLVSKQFERASILLGKVLFARCPKKPTIIY